MNADLPPHPCCKGRHFHLKDELRFMKKITSTTLKILIPLLISAVVLYYTYRDYDFSQFWTDMRSIRWGWLIHPLGLAHRSTFIQRLRAIVPRPKVEPASGTHRV